MQRLAKDDLTAVLNCQRRKFVQTDLVLQHDQNKSVHIKQFGLSQTTGFSLQVGDCLN